MKRATADLRYWIGLRESLRLERALSVKTKSPVGTEDCSGRDKTGHVARVSNARRAARLGQRGAARKLSYWSATVLMWIMTFTGRDGMPLATTSSVLSPVSASVGTWNQVETMAEPVATPDVLQL